MAKRRSGDKWEKRETWDKWDKRDKWDKLSDEWYAIVYPFRGCVPFDAGKLICGKSKAEGAVGSSIEGRSDSLQREAYEHSRSPAYGDLKGLSNIFLN